jgi:hypothetical protein
MPDALGKALTRASLRRLLGKVLRGAADLDAFCCDHFPDVHRQFSSGMQRDDKETVLVERCEVGEILAGLRQSHAEDTARFEALLVLDAPSSTSTVSDELLARILEIGARSAWPPEALAHAYYVSAPLDWRYDFDDNRSGDLAGRMLARLATALRQSDGAHPLLRFVLYIMGLVGALGVPEHTRELLSWVRDAAAYLGVDASTQQDLQREVETAALRDERELHLVVVMTKRADPMYDLAVSAWRVLVPPGKERWSAEDAARIEGYDSLPLRTSDMPGVMRDLFAAGQPPVEGEVEAAPRPLRVRRLGVQRRGCGRHRAEAAR